MMNALKNSAALLVGLTLLAGGAMAQDDVSLPGLPNPAAGKTPEDILKSPQWRATMVALQNWLNHQEIYSEGQVIAIKHAINDKVRKMSAEQMIEYQAELNRKLAVLHSKEAVDASMWMKEQMSLASPQYAAKMKSKLPDFTKMSANQLDAFLGKFEVRVSQAEQGSKDREQARAAEATMVTNQYNAEQRERDEAMNRAIQAGNTAPSGPKIQSSWNSSEGGGGIGGGWGGYGGWGGGWGGGYRW